MKLFRASVVLAGLAGTLAVSSCIQDDNKPQIVKVANAKTKDIIDVERIELKKKEGDLVKKLDHWTQWLDIVCSNLRDDEKIDDPYVELNFAHQEFLDTIIGPCGGGIVPPETALEKVTDEVKRIARSIVPPKRQKADFRVQPSKDQVGAYIKLITMADKTSVPSLDYILNKVEKDSKKRNIPGENLEKLKEHVAKVFEIHKRTLSEVTKETPRFIQALEVFNKDAEIAGQPPYEPTWGLSLELLKSLKSIK